MKKLFLSILLALFLLILKSMIADEIKVFKEETLSVLYGKNLVVEMKMGEVEVSSWPKEYIYIKVSGNEIAQRYLEYRSDSYEGNISIKIEVKETFNPIWNFKLKLQIIIPTKYNAKILTAGGDIHLSRITGNIKLSTAGGNIKVDGIIGESILNTSGGNIICDNLHGNIKASTSGGNIKLKCHDGNINAKTSGGSIKVEYNGINYGINLIVMGGTIHLFIPSDFAADVVLSTMGGSVKTDFPLETRENYGHFLVTGKINGGGKEVQCSSMGGNVIMTKLDTFF